MEEKDLKQIKDIVQQSIAESFEQEFPKAFEREFPKAFENAFPKAFEREFTKAFEKEFGEIWEYNLTPAFDAIEQRFIKIESQMVTKSYLDDKLADLEGGMVVKLRKEDEKVNGVIDSLKRHKIVPLEELKELDEYQVFPRISI